MPPSYLGTWCGSGNARTSGYGGCPGRRWKCPVIRPVQPPTKARTATTANPAARPREALISSTSFGVQPLARVEGRDRGTEQQEDTAAQEGHGQNLVLRRRRLGGRLGSRCRLQVLRLELALGWCDLAVVDA